MNDKLHTSCPQLSTVSVCERKEKEDWLAREEDDEDEIRAAHDHATHGALMDAWADGDEVRVRILMEVLGLEPDAVASLGVRA